MICIFSKRREESSPKLLVNLGSWFEVMDFGNSVILNTCTNNVATCGVEVDFSQGMKCATFDNRSTTNIQVLLDFELTKSVLILMSC